MYKVIIADQEIIVTAEDLEKLDVSYDINEGIYHVLDQGKAYKISQLDQFDQGKTQHLQINDLNLEASILDPLDQLVDSMGLSAMDDHKSNDIFAPMPGLILDIMCEEGDEVEEGKSLLILEAMKMENVIKAEGSGTVSKIHKAVGDTVEKGQLIIEIT